MSTWGDSSVEPIWATSRGRNDSNKGSKKDSSEGRDANEAPVGVARQVLVYIDGVKVAEVQASVPMASPQVQHMCQASEERLGAAFSVQLPPLQLGKHEVSCGGGRRSGAAGAGHRSRPWCALPCCWKEGC